MEINDLTHDLSVLVKEYLGDEYEIDKNIFHDYMPKDPDDIIGINEYTGTPPHMFTNTSVRSVQITSRHRSNKMAKDMAWKIYNFLFKEDLYIDIGTVRALISMRNTPFRMNTDDKGRSMWIFNMGITYRYKD